MENFFDLCAGARGIHEQMLAASQIHGVAGSCLFAAYLLKVTLTKFGRCHATIRGGDGDLGEGAKGVDGRWHGHYWVEFIDPAGDTFVADITADQFGYECVVLLPLCATGGRY